ncbi:DedA family protein [Pseudoroseomonas cervicalis]|uniref:DedA family protein n=1 Tax=Teichococcus cervicalis TaxID=204525 RepID=UPI002782E3B8|nr:DedA family protein [Pseudoroseomonas cervicalis]MDQ1081892.1 membrane protein DedA with SNARE-associated domain [Pseudoroseomonas cervicalis]
MSERLLTAFLAWIEAHQAWAGPAVFLLAFLEALPLVGLVVPGSALIFGAGLLVASGVLPLWPVMAGAALGAALGDSSGYWLARRQGRSLVRGRLPRRYRRLYARSLVGFRRWGWWAVFASRFFAPLRAFIPVVAGLAGMRHGRFQSANLPSALLWAPLILMPGQLLGWTLGLLPPLRLELLAAVTLLALAGALLLRRRARRSPAG